MSELEKLSPYLGLGAIYLKESRINALPRYPTARFVSFFLEERIKSEILREVDTLWSADSGHNGAWMKQECGKWIDDDDEREKLRGTSSP
ncbi:hypothetical protein OIU77_006630 [Salix suchowensis]|uniref:Uncharacterized protein n=1 Tax=Salix suchowensis TaxID=1278906 RepID=A0ABQ9ALA8_9ROSI|nr:hypothetical protein OIU77_006630 [Salix suchowensis]